MAIDRIVAWLRLRDTARFRHDAKEAADNIRKIGRAARDADGPLNQMGGAMSELFDKIPQTTGRTRIFGFAVGTVFTALTATVPLIVGLGGALVALAGSFGAATLGAGALATGLVGLAIPLGAFGIVAAEAFSGFAKVNTAFQRYQIAVRAFGRESQQAETALARLNATAEVMGGRRLVELVDRWNDLIDAFRKANAPAVESLIGIFGDFIQMAESLMPVFSELALGASRIVRAGLGQLFSELSSASGVQIFRDLGDAFAALGPQLMQAAIDLLMGFLRLASRAAPLLQPLVTDVKDLAFAFRNWATVGSLDTIIGQFYDWWGLIKSVGRLLVTILTGGASDGQNMVQSLTGVVDKWNEWLSTVEGQDSMRDFFRDAVDMTKAFFKVIAGVTHAFFAFGRALTPIYTVVFDALRSAWNDVMDAFAPAKPFWENVLKPFLDGLVGGILGGVVGSFKFLIFITKVVMAVLGFLGTILKPLGPAFRILGWIVGFIFGGWILKALSAIGKINILLKPLGLLFNLLRAPIRLAGAAVGWFAGKIGSLIGAVGGVAARLFSPLRKAIDGVLNWLTGKGAKFFDAGVNLWNKLKGGLAKAIGSGLGWAGDIGKAVANAVIDFLNSAIPNKLPVPKAPDINLPDNPIPKLAKGGVVSGPGSWITGEDGPELNTLINGKVIVEPLSKGSIDLFRDSVKVSPLTKKMEMPGLASGGIVTSDGSWVSGEEGPELVTMNSRSRVTVKPLAAGIQPSDPNATIEPGGGKRVFVSKVYLKGRQIAEAVADEADDDIARRGGGGD